MDKLTGIDALSGTAVEVEFDRSIRAVRSAARADVYLAPGFVDIQVNGFAGVDFNDPAATPDEIERAIGCILSTGVTRCLPTVITASHAHMTASLRNLSRASREIPHGAAMAGFHVEGPHIDPSDGPRGAHPLSAVRPPDMSEFEGWQEAAEGGIRLVTLSPHWPKADEYIARVREAGVTVAIGHTSASGDQISRAVDAGATLSTHLGNAAPKMLAKHPNVLWDQLAEDRLSASFIVDEWHLDPAFLRAALRAKGSERTVLITDAAAPAGAPPGPYRLGEVDVELTADERVVLRGGTRLAGSALRMDRAISNAVQVGRLSLREAIGAATINPARLIGLANSPNWLTPGARADFTVFHSEDRIGIDAVYVDGVRIQHS